MNWKAVAVVVFAPLIGALGYAIQTAVQWMAFETPARALATAFYLLPFGWVTGLVLTIIVGLPIGLTIAWVLQRLRLESTFSYTLAGTISAFFLSMILPSRTEFWLGITITGSLLGLGYWKTVRAKQLGAAHG